MDHKKIAKQLMELHQTAFNNPFNMIALNQDHSEKNFFRFVDKNPLFPDNSKDAIQKYLVTSCKRRSDFKSHCDGGCEEFTQYLLINRLLHRNK